MVLYLNRRTAGKKGKIRKNPGKNQRVDRHAWDSEPAAQYQDSVITQLHGTQPLLILFLKSVLFLL